MTTLNYSIRTAELAMKAYEQVFDDREKLKEKLMKPPVPDLTEWEAEWDRATEEMALRARQGVVTKRALIFEHALQIERDTIKPIVEHYKTDIPKNNNNTYMVTVRPKPGVEWEEFRKQTDKTCMKSKQIEKCAYTYEQKAETEDKLGEGFHMHMVCKWNKPWSQVLQSCKAAWGKLADENCIKVRECPNPEEVLQDYMVDYKSKDGHKDKTKEMDTLWRQRMGLQPVYYRDWAGGSSSTVPPQTQIEKNNNNFSEDLSCTRGSE